MDEAAQWAIAAQSGDSSAFKKILDRYEKPLLNFFYRFFGQREMAEDATQQLFLQLYRSLPDYQPSAKFNTFLYRIAKNLAINISRRNSVLSFFSLTDANETVLPSAPASHQPELLAEVRDRRDRIKKSLAKLPDRQRIAVILSYFDDCSNEEIAQRMDLSVSGVESLLFRARQNLKTSLQKFLVLGAVFISLVFSAAGLFAEDGDRGRGQTLKGLSPSLPSSLPSFALMVLPSNTTAENKLSLEWLDALEKWPQLRLTVGVASEDLPRLLTVRSRVLAIKSQGRLELALRLKGDPPIPLIYGLELAKVFLPDNLQLPNLKIGWPQDVTTPILKGKMDLKMFWGSATEGFVPGGGSLNLPAIEFLKKQNFGWTVAAFPEDEWAAGAHSFIERTPADAMMVFTPHPVSSLLYLPGNEPGAIVQEILQSAGKSASVPVIVFDEYHSAVKLAEFLDALGQELNGRKKVQALLGKEAKKQAFLSASAPGQIWPYSWPWITGLGHPRGPGLTAWIGDKNKNQAWDLLAQSRNEIERYKNSGRAVIEKLDRVMETFLQAESTLFFENFGAGENQPHNEIKFKQILGQVYAQLELPVPSLLKVIPSTQTYPVSSDSASVPSESVGSSSSAPVLEKTLLEIRKQKSEVTIDLVEDQTETAKEAMLTGISVRLSSTPAEEMVSFGFTLKNREKSKRFVHLYIDINHRQGAGVTRLVGNAVLNSEDGWEFLLSSELNGQGKISSALYRAQGSAPLYSTAEQSNSANGDKKEIFEVSVPRKFLGENVTNWGYLACVVDNEKSAILDLLAGVEDKKGLLLKLKAGQTSTEQVLLPMARVDKQAE